MNYLFYSEKTVPDYMKYSINTVLSVDKDASIYFCTDEKVNFKNVKTLKLSEIASDITKNIRDSNLDHKSSIARIFYLNDVMRELNLKYFVHFDNDVLIYKPFSSLKNVFMENKLSITKPSNSKIIFGYSYINSSEVLSKLTKKIIETIEFGVSNKWSFNYDVPFKEEDFLGSIYPKNEELFNLLPILPHENKFVFDPSSYGHYLDGTLSYPRKILRKGYISPDHYIGREIIANRINVSFLDHKPVVIWQKKEFDIVNLHLYSQRFEKFLPVSYKEYI